MPPLPVPLGALPSRETSDRDSLTPSAQPPAPCSLTSCFLELPAATVPQPRGVCGCSCGRCCEAGRAPPSSVCRSAWCTPGRGPTQVTGRPRRALRCPCAPPPSAPPCRCPGEKRSPRWEPRDRGSRVLISPLPACGVGQSAGTLRASILELQETGPRVLVIWDDASSLPSRSLYPKSDLDC